MFLAGGGIVLGLIPGGITDDVGRAFFNGWRRAWRRGADIGQWGGRRARPNAGRLRDNMEDQMGAPRGSTENRPSAGGRSRNQAHHIIPVSQNQHDLVAQLGLDLDNSFNGILLDRVAPNGSGASLLHDGYPNWHRGYNDAWGDYLDDVADDLGAGRIDLEGARSRVVQAQQNAIDGLTSTPSLGGEASQAQWGTEWGQILTDGAD